MHNIFRSFCLLWALSSTLAFFASGNLVSECGSPDKTFVRGNTNVKGVNGISEYSDRKMFHNKISMVAELQIPSFLKKAISAYTNLLSAHPYPTKVREHILSQSLKLVIMFKSYSI